MPMKVKNRNWMILVAIMDIMICVVRIIVTITAIEQAWIHGYIESKRNRHNNNDRNEHQCLSGICSTAEIRCLQMSSIFKTLLGRSRAAEGSHAI